MGTIAKRGNYKNFTEALRAGFAKRFGLNNNDQNTDIDRDLSNDFALLWSNAADGDTVEALRVDTDNLPRLGGAARVPQRQLLVFNLEKNGSLSDQQMFIADRAYRITGIWEIHKTAGSDAAAVTLNITKDTGTQAPAAGVTVMNGTFNMKGTANTLQTATLSSTVNDLILAEDDRLGANFTGTLTALAGVVVVVALTPACKSEIVRFAMKANGDLSDQAFFIANRPCVVRGIKYVHSTAGSDAGAVNVQVVKDTGTDAPGAGTDLLTNNSNAGFNCKGTANTVQEGTLAAAAATKRLGVGDRLSVDFAGTLTALAGVLVEVELEPLYNLKQVQFYLKTNGDLNDQAFFIADRDYLIRSCREVHSTAGSDAGAVNLQLTIDKATDAPGAGVDQLTNNSNAGFDLKGTANTVQVGTFVEEGNRYLLQGDRLSVDFAGTLTALVGVVVTVGLEPV